MSSESPACHGVTLEQYAGITAALADAFSLRSALDLEGLDEATWKRASRAWKERLVGDGIDGPLFAEFKQKQIAAEDWLGRPVAPLADDLPAWISFLHAYGARAAPFELLTAASLRLSDVARLQRRWSRRLDADDQLKKQAADLAQRGAAPLPAITVGTAELRPFPWSRGRVALPRAEAVAPAEELRDIPLDQYAALCAALAQPAADRTRILVRFGLDEARFSPPDAAWKRRLAADEALARDYRQLFDHQRARLRAAALGGTSLVLDVPRGPALPFVEADEPPAVAMPPVQRPPARTPSSLGGTSLAVDVPRGPALPFAVAGEPVRAPSPLAGTSLAVDVPRGPALPFSGSTTPAPGPTANQPARLLGATALSVDVPQGPALPFTGGNTGATPVGSKGSKLAQTSVFELPAHLRPKPAAAPPPAPAEPQAAAMLTLQQYASLFVELAMAPDRAAQILARYRLTPQQRESLDGHFQGRFAADPGLRAEWEQACATYRAWLVTQAPR